LSRGRLEVGTFPAAIESLVGGPNYRCGTFQHQAREQLVRGAVDLNGLLDAKLNRFFKTTFLVGCIGDSRYAPLVPRNTNHI